MEKCGLVRSSPDGNGDAGYSFADLGLLRQTDAEMATGVPFRRVLRALMALMGAVEQPPTSRPSSTSMPPRCSMTARPSTFPMR